MLVMIPPCWKGAKGSRRSSQSLSEAEKYYLILLWACGELEHRVTRLRLTIEENKKKLNALSFRGFFFSFILVSFGLFTNVMPAITAASPSKER